MEMTTIPVAFACDDNYAMPFGVTVESLLANKAKNTFYDIYCLIPGSFSQENINKIDSFKERYDNFNINFINLEELFSDAEPEDGSHISYVTYFRLVLPSKLKKYNRCIYMDVDIVVKEDLAQLYNCDMKDNYLAALAHPACYDGFEHCSNVEKGKYFNAGVLVFNLEQIRKDNMEEVFVKEVEKKYPLKDQDLLNINCAGRVHYLPLKFNAMINLICMSQRKIVNKMYGKHALKILKNPAIIHYSSDEKPWNFSFCRLGREWDKYFKQSPYAGQKLSKNFWSDLTKNKNKIRKWIFRFKWKKDFKVVRILGKYFVYDREALDS